MKRVEKTIAHMESIVEIRMQSKSGLPANHAQGIGSRFDVFLQPDGILRRIPPDWD